MDTNFTGYTNVNDFIMDPDFIAMVRREETDKIEQLILAFPDRKEAIEEAVIFVTYLHVEQNAVSDIQIETDWRRLAGSINRKKKQDRTRRLYLWASGVAASIAILFTLFTYLSGPGGKAGFDQRTILLSMLDSAEVTHEEIRIIAGDQVLFVAHEAGILQTGTGDLVVGGQRIRPAESKDEYVTVIVPKGKRASMQFSDGTVAWINSGSKLISPRLFTEASREISVEGEVFLDVAKNKEKPFFVHTRDFDVEVLGTQFNVSAYREDEIRSVVLVEGSVEVSTGHTAGVLKPNQGFFTEQDSFHIDDVDVYSYIAWKDGVMILQEETLGEIMKRLSRYYGIEIHIGEEFGKELYAGKLNLKESIEVVLYNLSLSTSFDYTREDKQIYIH